jgi:hypothetical protein
LYGGYVVYAVIFRSACIVISGFYSMFYLIWILGSQEGHQEGLEGSGQAAQEEGGRRRRQGQEEEVVQGKDPRQVEQLGPLRQGHLRQAVKGSPDLQADHPRHRQRKA